MKKILLFISLLFLPFMVHANSISSIDMDIKLDDKGTAHVTETWDASVSNGTEGWHPYFNIGKSEIKVTSASMDGKEFEVVEHWNERSSLESKAYKAGIYEPDSNEVDIVFGISDYGTHKYVINYDITNFVSTVNDADMIYWTLFPYDFSAEPDNVTIKITGPNEYPDTLDVWGFGMYGAPCYVKDGAIYMTSDGSISSSEYLTLLAKFPRGTFESESILEEDFQHYLDMANEGAEHYVDPDIKPRKRTFWEKLGAFFATLWEMLIAVFVFLGLGTLGAKASKNNKYNYGEKGKDLGKVPNFRDIPCDKDIFYAYWAANVFDLNKNKTDFLGAILLKWINEGVVTIEKVEVKKLLKSKEESVITFVNKPNSTITNETKLYDYMYEASKDGKLETDEFKKWCKTNYTKMLNWFDEIEKEERDVLVDKNLVYEVEQQGGKIFKYNYKQYLISDKAREEAIKMKGLKQFFKEFSRIDEKEPIEVKLWNEYLMYAQILGMAKEVMEQFKKLYPEIIEDMENYNYDYHTFMFVNSLSDTGVKAASAARSAAESYSSGGGGFSSGGGGGGSFGGGGGGGGFR